MYSQNQEEKIIIDYFHGKRGEKIDYKGYLLDVGANDGETFSNSRALLQLDWAGVLFEPTPLAFEKLNNLYQKNNSVVCLNCALGNETKKMELFESGEHLGKGDSGLLSTLKQSETKRWEGTKEVFTPIIVDCLSFRDFLEIATIKRFDFITIDVEGMEMEILEQMNLTELGCKMICVEWNQKDFDFYDRYMKSFGMKLIHKNAENLIYGR